MCVPIAWSFGGFLLPERAGIDKGGNLMSGYELKALGKRREALESELRRLVAVIDAIVAYENKPPKTRRRSSKSTSASTTVRTRLLERMQAEPNRVWSAREMGSETGDDEQQIRNAFKRLLADGVARRTTAGRYELSTAAISADN